MQLCLRPHLRDEAVIPVQSVLALIDNESCLDEISIGAEPDLLEDICAALATPCSRDVIIRKRTDQLSQDRFLVELASVSSRKPLHSPTQGL
jgi:hypothetical protein